MPINNSHDLLRAYQRTLIAAPSLLKTLAYWVDRMDGTDGIVSPQTVRDFVADGRAILAQAKEPAA